MSLLYAVSMRGSSLIWLVVVISLLGACSLVWWQITKPKEMIPVVAGSNIELSLPGIETKQGKKLITSPRAIVYEPISKKILYEQNGFERAPIASLTKLMTAMVAIDMGLELTQAGTIDRNEYGAGGNLVLHPGEEVTLKDLLAASLIGSANNATRALVREMGWDEKEFVREMNRKAVSLGLENTQFEDVTGLSPRNVSTAYEAAKMASVAFSDYPVIKELAGKAEYEFQVGGSDRDHVMRNSNSLLHETENPIEAGKTGFLYEAGYCLVSLDEDRLAVILGGESEDRVAVEVYNLLRLVL